MTREPSVRPSPTVPRQPSPLRSVCVFCGSRPGERPEYVTATRELGEEIARRGLLLIYGGGQVGLMGQLADAARRVDGEVVGVIPHSLERKEVGHQGLTRLEVVDSMHERKARMSELSDAFIALPGGLGTLEELFETWTWGQLGIHPKPLGLLDVEGYYEQLSGFLDHATEEGFIDAEHRSMVLRETSPAALLDRFADYRPPVVEKWLEREET